MTREIRIKKEQEMKDVQKVGCAIMILGVMLIGLALVGVCVMAVI